MWGPKVSDSGPKENSKVRIVKLLSTLSLYKRNSNAIDEESMNNSRHEFHLGRLQCKMSAGSQGFRLGTQRKLETPAQKTEWQNQINPRCDAVRWGAVGRIPRTRRGRRRPPVIAETVRPDHRRSPPPSVTRTAVPPSDPGTATAGAIENQKHPTQASSYRLFHVWPGSFFLKIVLGILRISS